MQRHRTPRISRRKRENLSDVIRYWLCIFALSQKGQRKKSKILTQNTENFHKNMLYNLSTVQMLFEQGQDTPTTAIVTQCYGCTLPLQLLFTLPHPCLPGLCGHGGDVSASSQSFVPVRLLPPAEYLTATSASEERGGDPLSVNHLYVTCSSHPLTEAALCSLRQCTSKRVFSATAINNG